MEKQADRGIESQETDREGADIHGGRQRNKQLERQTDGETGRQRDRESRDRTERGQTYMGADKETKSWRDRQMEIQEDTGIESHRQAETLI